MHGDVVAIGRQHRAQRPLRIEPGQTAALRGHEEHRFEHGRQARLADLRPEPAELLFEVGVAVAGDDGQNRPLVGVGRRREAAHAQGGGRGTCGYRSSHRLMQTTTAGRQERHENSLVNDQVGLVFRNS